MITHPGKKGRWPGLGGLGVAKGQKCSDIHLQDSTRPCQLPPSASNKPAGRPVIFFKSLRKGSKSWRRRQVPLRQLPITAIINVSKPQQLRLPPCQNKQPATPDGTTQRIITQNKTRTLRSAFGNSRALKHLRHLLSWPDAGPRAPQTHCLVGTE